MEKMFGAPMEDRLPGSLACACWAVGQGAQIIRAHDVAATKQAALLTRSLMELLNNGQRSAHDT
jgi:dihydropteroate synthase